MKVVCIDDTIEVIGIGGEAKSPLLTKGKVYEANQIGPPIYNDGDDTGDNGIYYMITTLDNGSSRSFYRRRFIPIEEYRQNQLNDILE